MGFCTAFREFSLFPVNVHLASAASHSLHYFYTGVTSEIHFPEFSVVGLVDGEQFVYYDSSIRKKIPKTGWMEKSVGEDYWTRETQKAQGAQETFKASVGPIMRRFSQTEEAAVSQSDVHSAAVRNNVRTAGLRAPCLPWKLPQSPQHVTTLTGRSAACFERVSFRRGPSRAQRGPLDSTSRPL
ncbi:hypothetical protein MHYP_G00140430 [Metynnis hypsauchen]